MKIDLIALDLDDTLLNSSLNISEGNRRAIIAAENAGIEIVLATGRNYAGVRKYIPLLDLGRKGNYLVCSNGAEILEAATGSVIERLMLSSEFCREASEFIDSEGLPWQVYMDGKIFCSRVNDWALMDEKITGQPLFTAGPKDSLFKNGQIKFVVPGKPEIIAELYEKASALFSGKAEVVTSKPYFMEILPLGADKGSALRRLTARLGIPMEKVMAIGDAMNDMSMIREAGWGCAPSNALERIKAAARHVSVKSHDQDAVADILYAIALPEDPSNGTADQEIA
ncbi:MAG: Cof-type HAD-IIB family hydrolase [Spirochaetia bacterium]|jgi:Cof subfamily protein (haloacid dehalogenase superfamily)|nr:Cof-type HAD-IIB family hydrolase [Spirochaetia bacterium]